MQVMEFGKRGTVLGFPIGLSLIVIAFYNIYSINELLTLLNIHYPYMHFHYLGTLISVSFDFVRSYLLIKMVTAVLWGVLVLINVAVFRHAIWLAYITLIFASIYYVELVVGLSYGMYAFSQDYFIESKYALRRSHMRLLFGWPKHFWILFAANIVADILIGYTVLDAHFSFIKILQHRGSGWESKAYHEIHQSEGETVATLQAQWDARMGLEKKRDPELERMLKQQQLENDERSPLITEV